MLGTIGSSGDVSTQVAVPALGIERVEEQGTVRADLPVSMLRLGQTGLVPLDRRVVDICDGGLNVDWFAVL